MTDLQVLPSQDPREQTDGRTDLLEALHHEHGRALMTYCLGLTGNDHKRAEDVAQETFLRAWRNLPKLDESAGSLRSWLFTVGRNIVIDEWRTKRSQTEVVAAEVPDSECHPDPSGRVLDSSVLASALDELSPEHRCVLVESYYRGRPIAEIAERLGVPSGTVKSRMHYALKSLRARLEDVGYGVDDVYG